MSPTRKNHGRRADANRHDTYVTTPEAAAAIRPYLPGPAMILPPDLDILDPFGGFGTLGPWAGVPRARWIVNELDDRPERRAELARYCDRVTFGDGFAMRWTGGLLTNPPFTFLRAVFLRALAAIAAGELQWAAILGPIQPWHTARFRDVPDPEAHLALDWRPDFAAGYGYAGTETSSPSQSYVWTILRPFGRRVSEPTIWTRLRRPHVSAELVAEHARLARIAAEWPAVSPAPLLEGAT